MRIKNSILVIILVSFTGFNHVWCQQTMPEVMDTGTLQEQLDWMHDRFLIYENYRAIREDVFQKMRRNALDSLNAAKGNINAIERELAKFHDEVDSLDNGLAQIREELDVAIRNRNSLTFLGIRMNKTLYNSIMWSVIVALAVILVFVFLSFSRSRTITVQTRKDLEGIRQEFEDYRKRSRERYEKLVVSHHNEVRKLKESK